MFFFHFAQFFRLNCFRTHGVCPQKTFLHIKVTLGFIGEVFFVLKQALSLNEFANSWEAVITGLKFDPVPPHGYLFWYFRDGNMRNSRHWLPDCLSVELGFRIPRAVFRIFQSLQQKICWIPESEFLYMVRHKRKTIKFDVVRKRPVIKKILIS